MFRRAPCALLRSGMDRPLLYPLAFVACIALEGYLPFDRFFQRIFFTNGTWILSDTFHTKWKLFLYTGPKILVTGVGCACLLALAVALMRGTSPPWKKPALLIALSIVLIPLLTASMKAVTGVYSPVDLSPYGGSHPHIGFIEQLYRFGHPAGGRSFPAGHASGGFALMSLCYLPASSKVRNVLFYAGLSAGWLMGLYQMGRGEHFMSHTLATQFLALTILSLLARALRMR